MGKEVQNGNVPFVAKVVTASENASTSSVISLGANTTFLEVTAVGSTGFVKWIATGNTSASVISDAGTANADHVIPLNTSLWLPIPQETAGTSSIVGANIQNGLYQRIAYKTAAAGSIYTIQF